LREAARGKQPGACDRREAGVAKGRTVFKLMINFLCGSVLAAVLAGCSTSPVAMAPDPASNDPVVRQNPSLRIAVLDHHLLGDLSDPVVMAKYARADILITQPDKFWGSPGLERNMELLRAANPNVKILGFFRSKCVRIDWRDLGPNRGAYDYDLYQAALPYLSYTTTGDTLQDWPGVILFDFTQPAARDAMLDVFVRYQTTSTAKLDGVYWDYFNNELWIANDVTTMEGQPDMDGDGVEHFSDADEKLAFQAAQVEWIREMRARLGDDFIQVANGVRALRDSTFAGLLDGMNYEIFPNVGLNSYTPYRTALDPTVFNNLWASNRWLRTANGGPWQILENVWVPRMQDQNQVVRPINLGDVNRAIALLTGSTVIHYDLTGQHHAGLPDVEINLGEPLGGVTIDGNLYTRAFEEGTVALTMGTGAYPMGFSFRIERNDRPAGEELVNAIANGYMYP
jgi:hypothetical protein